MLSDAEIEAATGQSVTSKDAVEGAGGFLAPGCRWQLEETTSWIQAGVRRTGGLERFNFVYSSAEKIPGVGDDAAFQGGNIGGTVAAVAGDTMVDLGYSLPVTTSDPRPIVVPLLQSILSRL